jgi:membrane associated rhomboid family serine protease
LGFNDRLEQTDRSFRAAVSYAIQNPVVAIDPRLLPAVRGAMPSFESNEMFSFLRNAKPDGHDGPTPQQELDQRTTHAFAALDGHPMRRLGLVPADPAIHAFVSHAFLHAGLAHLLLTVAIFMLAAPYLEQLWGRRVLICVMVFVVAATSSTFLAVHGSIDQALLGGAGIVAAMVGAILIRFRGEEIDFLGWLGPFVDAELTAPAWALGAVWVLYEGLLHWIVPGALPAGIDNAVGYSAHAGGFLLGAGFAHAIQKLGWEARYGRVGFEARARGPERFSLESVIALQEEGDDDGAYAMLAGGVQQNARNRDVVTLFWRLSVEREAIDAAVPAMLRLVREELRRGADEVAVAHWREVTAKRPEAFDDPVILLRLIPAIRRVEDDETAVVAVRQAADWKVGSATADVVVQLSRLAAELDPSTAFEVAQRALAGKGFDEAQRAELEAVRGRFAPKEPGEGEVASGEEKPDPRPSAFYDESDRSEFGEIGDLSALDERFPESSITEGVPRTINADGLRVSVGGDQETTFAIERIRAVSVVGVRGLGPKPIVLVDVLVDGGGLTRPLGVIRLRSDQFDPRRLIGQDVKPLDALRRMVGAIQRASGAIALPRSDEQGSADIPVFDSLEAYHEAVLQPAGIEFA